MNGQRLKLLRKERKLSQKELGLKLNLAESTISLYESEKRTPDNNTLFDIAKFFNVSTDYLLNVDENKKQVNKENNQPFNPTLTEKDEKDIAKKLESTLDQLENSKDALMFDGEPLDEETKELLRISLENSIRLSKQIAKKKFTPNKYR